MIAFPSLASRYKCICNSSQNIALFLLLLNISLIQFRFKVSLLLNWMFVSFRKHLHLVFWEQKILETVSLYNSKTATDRTLWSMYAQYHYCCIAVRFLNTSIVWLKILFDHMIPNKPQTFSCQTPLFHSERIIDFGLSVIPGNCC